VPTTGEPVTLKSLSFHFHCLRTTLHKGKYISAALSVWVKMRWCPWKTSS